MLLSKNSHVATLISSMSSTEPRSQLSTKAALVEEILADALMKAFGPDWVPNEHGLAIERAINAYFDAWPMS
jgi:hypothetical protein